MKLALIPAALVALAAAFAPAAQAQVVNGDFSAGLAGWSTLGDASVKTADAASPTRLWLTTASVDYEDDLDAGLPAGARNASGTPAADIALVEPFLGVATYGLDDPAGPAATEGSAAAQAFTAAAGSTLRFSWDFGTLDPVDDAAFVIVDGRLFTLATSTDATLPGIDGNATHTGWADWSTTFAAGGAHTIAFGVVDRGDYDATSTLAIADVNLSIGAVPEAPVPALLAGGLALVAVGLRRSRA
ncbi:MAG: hypothetical protein ACTHL8_26290 [Burkholderiaceae bacterium]